MSKASELYALRYSFSGDSKVATHTRSGDATGDGAERWNFIGSVQSAEADIIDEEERAERREAKRKFARLLGLYFKKILSPVEFQFLAESLKGAQTLYKVGLEVGIDYKQAILNIKAKHKANEQKFLLLMQYSGYDFRHGLEFLPKFERAYRKYEVQKAYAQSHRVQIRERCRRYDSMHRTERRQSSSNYYSRNREQINERRRLRKKELLQNPETRAQINEKNRQGYARRKAEGRLKKYPLTEEKRLYQKNYHSLHREKLNAQKRAKIALNPEKRREYERQYYALHKEQAKASRRKYEATHRDKINARRRLRRAEAKQKKLLQESKAEA